MRFSKLWYIVLAIWLILFGVNMMGWIDISGDILGIGAIIAGVLVLVDR